MAMTTLPAKGRSGPAPAWPLPTNATIAAAVQFWTSEVERLEVELADAETGQARANLRRSLNNAERKRVEFELLKLTSEQLEGELWAALWATPQATEWERARAERSVASYVRWQVQADLGDLKATGPALALSDRLGLTPLSLMKLRQEVERTDEVTSRGERRRQPAEPKRSAGGDPRNGLRAV